MEKAIASFHKFALLEKKEEDEELTINDAKKLGVKIANMDGEDKKKYVGIINFLGASCNIYNEVWKNYKRTRDRRKD